jgi:hypothetical protein
VLTAATARGAGPALLLVAGGGGDHGYYDGPAGQLAGELPVLATGHTAPMEIPGAFGPVLRDLLHHLRGSGVLRGSGGTQRDGGS